ncbi:DUF6128 domain-containing protein [Anaerosporobacter sp.]
MSEYKRLISYIYNYEKGLKKNNVGFAKIELRNGQCKISINIKAASLNGQKLRTYVFYRENKRMIQILLAEAVVKNGVFEWKGITNANNIMNTGHNFNQLGGVLLYYSLNKYFATEWDDQPITLNHLYEWDVTESLKIDEKEIVNDIGKEIVDETINETINETLIQTSNEMNRGEREPKFVEVPKDEITYINKKQEAEEAISKSQEEIVQSILKSIDYSWELFCNIQDDNESQLDLTSRKEAKSRLQAAELYKQNNSVVNINGDQDSDISPETAKLLGYRFINWYRGQETGFPKTYGKVKISDIVNESIDTKQSVEVEKEDQEASQMDLLVKKEFNEDGYNEVESDDGTDKEERSHVEIVVEEESDHEQLDEEYEDKVSDEVAASTAEGYVNTPFNEEQRFYSANKEKEWNARLEEVAKKKTSTAERILQKYPAINPFEDDEILACVRIEPGDIGLFPIENWVLGNNSFLLHGYYNFRHLIFAKKKAIDGEEYILGIPGIYQNREKFMAKMFGFTQFKCAKNVEQKTGEFGYWYIKVNM